MQPKLPKRYRVPLFALLMSLITGFVVSGIISLIHHATIAAWLGFLDSLAASFPLHHHHSAKNLAICRRIGGRNLTLQFVWTVAGGRLPILVRQALCRNVRWNDNAVSFRRHG